MPRHRARGLRAFRSISIFVVVALAGCSFATPAERAGVDFLNMPAGWTPTSMQAWTVPGVPLGAWKGPRGASFVLYRELSAVGNDPASIASRTANRYANFPGLNVISAKTVVFSRPAARIEATAPGTGEAWLPTGTGEPVATDGRTPIPTRRVLISVPMESETLSFLWHAPDDNAADLFNQIEQFRPRLRPIRPDVQSY